MSRGFHDNHTVTAVTNLPRCACIHRYKYFQIAKVKGKKSSAIDMCGSVVERIHVI